MCLYQRSLMNKVCFKLTLRNTCWCHFIGFMEMTDKLLQVNGMHTGLSIVLCFILCSWTLLSAGFGLLWGLSSPVQFHPNVLHLPCFCLHWDLWLLLVSLFNLSRPSRPITTRVPLLTCDCPTQTVGFTAASYTNILQETDINSSPLTLHWLNVLHFSCTWILAVVLPDSIRPHFGDGGAV